MRHPELSAFVFQINAILADVDALQRRGTAAPLRKDLRRLRDKLEDFEERLRRFCDQFQDDAEDGNALRDQNMPLDDWETPPKRLRFNDAAGAAAVEAAPIKSEPYDVDDAEGALAANLAEGFVDEGARPFDPPWLPTSARLKTEDQHSDNNIQSKSKGSRNRTSSVYNYFIDYGSQFKCTLNKDGKPCEVVLTRVKSGGASSGNLKRHLMRSHLKEFEEVQKRDESAKVISQQPAREKRRPPSRPTLIKFLPPSSSNTATVIVKKADFESGILEMVTYDGVPLTVFSGTGFKTIAGTMAERLGVSLQRDSIAQLLLDRVEREKEKIIREIEEKFFFLKFDAVTRHGSRFLGVTIQYWTDEGLAVRTLSLVDTLAYGNDQLLRDYVLNVMERFGLPISRLLCCVVDDGSNRIKTMVMMDEAKRECESDGDWDKEDYEDDDDEEEELDETRFPILDSSFPQMRCGAYTLQRSIEDAIETGQPASFIEKLRHVAKKLRAPKLNSILKSRCGEETLVPYGTSWASKLAMTKRILQLEPFIKDLPLKEIRLTDSEWEELESLVTILEIPHKATLTLQRENLTPGECLLEWREVIFRLKKLGSNLGLDVARSIETMEKCLLENDVFLAAAWVDLRSRLLLTHAEKDKAKKILREIHSRWEGASSPPAHLLSPLFEIEGRNECETDFESYLNSLASSNEAEEPQSLCAFRMGLDESEKMVRVKGASIWDTINLYPKIVQPIARTVCSLPSARVSVEGIFSYLKIISRQNLGRLSPELADAILFLRTNRCLRKKSVDSIKS